MLTLRNNEGITKEAPVGFSLTVLLFGFFVPMFREDWKFAAIMFVASIAAGLVVSGIGSWIILILFAIKYNEWYIDDLKSQGYRVIS